MVVKPQRTTFSRIIPTGDKRSFILLGGAAILWWITFDNLQAVADVLTYDLLGLREGGHLGVPPDPSYAE